MANDVKAEESWILHLKQSRTNYRDTQFDCVRHDILKESLPSHVSPISKRTKEFINNNKHTLREDKWKLKYIDKRSVYKFPLIIMSIDDNSATFNQRSSFINRICLLLTAQCRYLWWLVMIGGCEYSQVLIFLKGMWEGYEIQPAHRPFINTRRDSQAVMQDISHPGMIHFVSLSSHSPV